MKRGFTVLWASVTLAALVGSAIASTSKYYVWNHPTAACPTDASDSQWNDDQADAWQREMIDQGYTGGGRLVDGDIDLDRFCDPDSTIAGCSDASNGIDAADAVFFSMHGSDDGDHWTGLLRNAGSSGASCSANDNGDLRVGDYDAEFVHAQSCHSMDDDNLSRAWTMLVDPVDSPVNGRRLHLFTGFHGLSVTGEQFIDEGEKLAREGFRSAVADAWVDLFYVPTDTVDGEVGEICPVAYAVGASLSDCQDRLLDDRYDAPGSDPAAHTHYCLKFVEDCDGYDEGVFNP